MNGRLYAHCMVKLTDFLGVSLFFAARSIATRLNQVLDLTQIKNVEKEDRMISEGAEDGK